MREELLPYFEERETPIDMVVLHCSAYNVETIIKWMHEYQISAHYIIDEQGNITKLVNESKRRLSRRGGILARGRAQSQLPFHRH